MASHEDVLRKVSSTLVEALNIDEDEIKPASTLAGDLGAESIDFLDIEFRLEREFGIKIPLEQWTQDVNEGKVSTEEYFVLKNLCAKIDELKAAKG